ncbi:MAG TPA: amidohydrolase family protein [Gemmatimonadales bacterium]|nr:amidohydrolase family protein [Gemmatimonadales bacterium]
MARPIRPGTAARLLALVPLQLALARGLCAQTPARAAASVVAVRGGTILPMSGPEIRNGVLLIEGGKIAAVGPADRVTIPAGAQVIDASGKVVMPGLVDTHSHIADAEWNDRASPIQGDVRILDALNPFADGVKRARAGGITTVNVMPGSGHLMSGQTAYLKLRDATRIEDMLLCRDPITEICGGMKMANGTNSRGEPPFPGSRAKSAAIVREKFVKALEYRQALQAAATDSSKRPARDLELEAIGEVLDGKRVVHFHTHRADDILTALRLQREFGFRLVLHHVSEGWKVAKEIAAAKVPVSLIVIDAPGGKQETIDWHPENAATLQAAGVLIGFHTDDWIIDSRYLIREAAMSVRAGMPRQAALEALTTAGAKILGLDNRIGSLERGKDADFLILSGDPLSVYTHVEQTWIDGKKLFDIHDPVQRNYATGGYGYSRDDRAELDEDSDGEVTR